MPKPKKNKTGLHKKISSVLKGVPIPQGVRNWRPPDKPGADQTGDSSAVPKSNTSSVFKGVPVPADNESRQPACKHEQDHPANTSPIRPQEGRQASQNNLGRKSDCTKEPTAETAGDKQVDAENRVAYYRGPPIEGSRRSLREWIWEKLFGAKD